MPYNAINRPFTMLSRVRSALDTLLYEKLHTLRYPPSPAVPTGLSIFKNIVPSNDIMQAAGLSIFKLLWAHAIMTNAGLIFWDIIWRAYLLLILHVLCTYGFGLYAVNKYLGSFGPWHCPPTISAHEHCFCKIKFANCVRPPIPSSGSLRDIYS